MPKKATVKTITVQARLPEGLVEEIDQMVNLTKKWASRSDFISKAADYYLERARQDMAGLRVYTLKDDQLQEMHGVLHLNGSSPDRDKHRKE
jgi:metal-responsive CopG/Arc/MetJ family transcriptional regulator